MSLRLRWTQAVVCAACPWHASHAPATPAPCTLPPTTTAHPFCCSQGGEDDIDSLLAQFKLRDATRSSVKVKECGPPPPRVFASFLPLPSQKENEAILFGVRGSRCLHSEPAARWLLAALCPHITAAFA